MDTQPEESNRFLSKAGWFIMVAGMTSPLIQVVIIASRCWRIGDTLCSNQLFSASTIIHLISVVGALLTIAVPLCACCRFRRKLLLLVVGVLGYCAATIVAFLISSGNVQYGF